MSTNHQTPTQKAPPPRSPFPCLAGQLALLSAMLLACVTATHAASYYVDKTAGGSLHDGQSWATAWVRFADIQWGSGGVGSGDTLYVSGGTTSKIYYERLVVGAAGTASARLVVTKGIDPGHDGTVIIDGEFQRSAGIHIEGRDYVTVSHFDIRQSVDGDGKGDLYIRSSTGVIAENCTIIMEKAHGGIYLNGYGEACRNTIIRNCVVTTPAKVCSGQTDGIYSGRNINSIFEGNTFIIRNENAALHCDAIQCYKATDVTIRNNYCEQDNQKGSNAQGIFISDSAGISRIYNNICVAPNATSSLLKFRITDGSTGGVRFYNNTAVGGQYLLIRSDSSDTVMKNNIFFSTGDGLAGIPVINLDSRVTINNPSDYDNNLIYSANSADVVTYKGSARSWAEWQALGADAHGLSVNPQLDANHRPQAASPAIDAGMDLSALGITLDSEGTLRPQGAAFDIGAFEYSANGTPSPPQAPSNLVVVPGN